MRRTGHCLALLALILAAPINARADDFASDFASCAKAPIVAAEFAAGPLQTAAQFLANHGECVPQVVSGDPLLIGMSGGVASLMVGGVLPKGAQACIDASIGGASRPVAGVIRSTPGVSSFLPASGMQLLQQIADGPSQATLYDVPGIGLVIDHLSCSCAIASTGLKAAELKEALNGVLNSLRSCKEIPGKILKGAYAVGAAAVGALANAAKGAINSVGCTLHLGGCGSSGPPFFCVGYNYLRSGGSKPQDIAGIFPSIFPADFINDNVNKCEKAWTDAKIAAAVKAKEEAELEKAEKLGAANALGFAFLWSPRCFDETCKASIAGFANKYTVDIQDPETIQMYGSFAVAKKKLDDKYGALATVAVALSKDRHDKALRADVNAPPAERLPAFGCNSYLGRQRQSLCAKPGGFEICKGYASKGAWDLCALEGAHGAFAAGEGLKRVLRVAGCIPDSESLRVRLRGGRPPVGASNDLTAQCLSPHARAQCDALAAGRSTVACKGPVILALHRNAPYTPVRQVQPEAPPPVQLRPMRPLQPATVPPFQRMPAPPVSVVPETPLVETSTLCRFTEGPRRGQTQDYAPMAPIPVGSSCQDGRGSTGVVVAP